MYNSALIIIPSHVTSFPDHCPLQSHILVASPIRTYPALHSYSATRCVELLTIVTIPFSGSLRAPQLISIREVGVIVELFNLRNDSIIIILYKLGTCSPLHDGMLPDHEPFIHTRVISPTGVQLVWQVYVATDPLRVEVYCT